MTRRWTINGRFLAQPETGVQRHAREVVRALDRLLVEDPSLAREIEIEIVAPPDAAAFPLEAIELRRVGRFGGHPWEQAVLARHAGSGLLSLCNTGPVRHRKQILCIHDTNTRTCPRSYSRSFRALYRVLLPALGHTAVAVTTVSRFSAGEIAGSGICPLDKITVVPNGHEHVDRWQPAHSVATRAVANRRTIVLIGSPAPHKNVGLVLDLAERLRANGLSVAVVGAADPRVFRGNVVGGFDNVIWLGRLGDAHLAALLSDCLCLAFPSLTEGFGLPPLEAMALGCPVVVSDRASMPEVCGDAALYASPDSPDAWLRHFVELSRSPNLRSMLASRGRARSAQFRWRDAAKSYLRAMARADGLESPGGLTAQVQPFMA